jgi:hypothetical protein
MIEATLDFSVHPEGCTCSVVEIVKVEGDSITLRRHDVSPCTVPWEER